MGELLKELSNHNERVEERKAALSELLKLIHDNMLQVWDEHFKTILLLLLETMSDREVGPRNTRLSFDRSWIWFSKCLAGRMKKKSSSSSCEMLQNS